MYLVDINADGSGSSGNWVANLDRHDRPGKFIIYNRLPDQVPRQSEIYLANYVDAVASPDPGRIVVRFQDAKQMGTTNQNWDEFAGSGIGPVRYLSKR